MEEHENHATLSWQAPEYERRERTRDWFIALWILTGAAAAASFILKNFTFGALLLLIGFVLTLLAKRPPKILTVVIQDDSIRFGGTRYSFDQMVGFFVETYGPEDGLLLFQMKATLMPIITIPIADIAPKEVERVMALYVPRKKIDESVLEKLIHYFGI